MGEEQGKEWLFLLWSEAEGNPLRRQALRALIVFAWMCGFGRLTTADLCRLPV